MVHEDGTPGMWVELEEFRHLAGLEANKEDQLKLQANLEARLELNLERATMWKEAHDLAVEDRSQIREYAAQLESRLDSPLRSPIVWFAAGVALGAVAVIAVK
jgi:hypothetical protein